MTVKHGFPFQGKYFTTEGKYIVLTPGNFYENGSFKRIIGKEKYYAASFPKEYLCTVGELIIAMTEQAEGLLGSTAIIPEAGIYLHNQRIGLISCNEDIVDQVYIYYLFMTKSVRKQIRDTSSGTKVKHTSPERIYDVDVLIPERDEQEKIAILLRNIDKKIDVNNCIISELEKMTKTIYDYWFLQFDFPDDKGKPYRSSDGEMVWNEQLKIKIPMHWNVGNLYTIATFTNGIACQKYRPSEDEDTLPVIKIKEMHRGITEDTETVTVNIPEKIKIRCGDILFSWSATLEVQLWAGQTAALNQHIFRITPKEPYTKNYVYEQLASYVGKFIKMAEARKTTMGHITSDHLEQSRIVLPHEEIIVQYEKKVAPLFIKIMKTTQENQELKKLRDWLLPMLMNGQIRLK